MNGQQSAKVTAVERSQLDFLFFVDLIREKIVLLIAAGAIFGVVGYAMSFLFTPMYRADAVLIPSSPFGQTNELFGGGMLGDLAGFALPDDQAARLNHSLEILYSRAFAMHFASQNDVLRDLFIDRWDSDAEAWGPRGTLSRLKLTLEGIDVERIGAAPTAWEIQERFANAVTIQADPETDVYFLSVVSRDPDRAAVWANQIVEQLNDRARHVAVTEARATIRYLTEELAEAAFAETRQALSNALERQFERVALSEAQKDYVFTIIDPAMASAMPASPRRLMTGALMALFGVFACGALLTIVSLRRALAGARE